METPIIVCSHQNDWSVDNAEDVLPRDEKPFVAAPGEDAPLPVVVVLPGAGCSDIGQ